MRIVTMEGNEIPVEYIAHTDCSMISTTKFSTDKPDSHLLLVNDDVVVARCSLWWRKTPQLDRQRTGYIGHFDCCDVAGGERLLRQACDGLKRKGCDIVIGPIDGSTWKSYRFITQGTGYPEFFMEPESKLFCLDVFHNCGFEPLANYVSVLNTDIDWIDQKTDTSVQSLQQKGFHLHNFDLADFDNELTLLYELSLRSFARNFLYTPIELDDFLSVYEPLRQILVPELMLLVKQNETLVGFLFAIPDLAQAQRGETVDTVIIKTLAVDPAYGNRRIGSWLSKTLYQRAKVMGFRRVIHALMHDDNLSRSINSKNAQAIRRYSLFACQLCDAR